MKFICGGAMRQKALGLLLCLLTACGAHAQQSCDENSFRSAAASASSTLKEVMEQNSRLFQEKLQRLRVTAGWSDADLRQKAVAFIKDDITAALDAEENALRAQVEAMSAREAAASEAARCAMLAELKTITGKLIDNTKTRWEHMIGKVNAASSVAVSAGMAN
jgi:hypothetical protein